MRSVLSALVLTLAACSTEKKPNYTRTGLTEDTPSTEMPSKKTTRTGRGEMKIDATIQDPEPLTGVVQIKTWADEVIRGRVLSESEDAYVLDVGPPDGSKPSVRRVPRSAVMDLTKAH